MHNLIISQQRTLVIFCNKNSTEVGQTHNIKHPFQKLGFKTSSNPTTYYENQSVETDAETTQVTALDNTDGLLTLFHLLHMQGERLNILSSELKGMRKCDGGMLTAYSTCRLLQRTERTLDYFIRATVI